ncbi:MAG: plasmid pRiA4b ORF-3 family protein, partial [Elusimicrobia bacterium]|nr:plasmid pRiA4b ORF-3 family protein [Elusimicrobiota bacterium]
MLQLKITLDGIEPPIWRRILVPSWIPFLKLHKIIQRAMGWKDCHQHSFASNGRGELKSAMEKSVQLGHLIKKEGEVWGLCRIRHKPHNADSAIMPTWRAWGLHLARRGLKASGHNPTINICHPPL